MADNPAQLTSKINPSMHTLKSGRLFYLVGASGTGKDSLLMALRDKLTDTLAEEALATPNEDEVNQPTQTPLLIAHRYITRPSNLGTENHVELSLPEFKLRQNLGLFAMHWHRHDTLYGIGCEIEDWQTCGAHVLVNGSRAYLPTASKKYSNLVVIHLQVAQDTLKQRLQLRGRDTQAQIASRLKQAKRVDEQLKAYRQHLSFYHTIDNNGELSEALNQFLSILAQYS